MKKNNKALKADLIKSKYKNIKNHYFLNLGLLGLT